MENKIKEILSNRADYYIDSNGKSHDIIRGHPDDIMDEIVKLFAIPDVSNCYMADCLIQDSCLRFKQKGCNKDCKLYM